MSGWEGGESVEVWVWLCAATWPGKVCGKAKQSFVDLFAPGESRDKRKDDTHHRETNNQKCLICRLLSVVFSDWGLGIEDEGSRIQ